MKRMMSSITGYMKNDAQKMRHSAPRQLNEMERALRRKMNDARSMFEALYSVPEAQWPATAEGRDMRERQLDVLEATQEDCKREIERLNGVQHDQRKFTGATCYEM